MSCQTVQKFISAYMDRKLAGEERDIVARHLAGCRECASHSEQLLHLRSVLRSLPVPAPPKSLTSRLRVVASHERARRVSRVTWKSWFDGLSSRIGLTIDNMMRPLALPFAGGLLSALCLFGVLMPTLLFQYKLSDDVPTAFYTEASLSRISPAGFMSDETIIELTINERGQVTDYSVPFGKLDQSLQIQLANLVMFSQGAPATLFGQPTSGKVLVSFRRSHIVVRG